MTAWIADTWQRRSNVRPDRPATRSFLDRLGSVVTPLSVSCAVLAISPDFDVFFHTHRTYTHSLGAAGIVWLLVALVAWRLRLPVVKIATACAMAYASHVLLDWLGHDASGGLMVLWPVSTEFYRSGLNVFLEIGGHPGAVIRGPASGFLRIAFENRAALAREVLILGPLFLAVMTLRLKRWQLSASGARRPAPLRGSVAPREPAGTRLGRAPVGHNEQG